MSYVQLFGRYEVSNVPFGGGGVGGYNLSTFGHFVPGSTYFVHSFWGYEALTKIRLSKGSYGSPIF